MSSANDGQYACMRRLYLLAHLESTTLDRPICSLDCSHIESD